MFKIWATPCMLCPSELHIHNCCTGRTQDIGYKILHGGLREYVLFNMSSMSNVWRWQQQWCLVRLWSSKSGIAIGGWTSFTNWWLDDGLHHWYKSYLILLEFNVWRWQQQWCLVRLWSSEAPRVELPLVAGKAAPFGGWITQAADDLHQKANAAFLHAAPKYPPPYSFLPPSLSLQCNAMWYYCKKMQCNWINALRNTHCLQGSAINLE